MAATTMTERMMMRSSARALINSYLLLFSAMEVDSVGEGHGLIRSYM